MFTRTTRIIPSCFKLARDCIFRGLQQDNHEPERRARELLAVTALEKRNSTFLDRWSGYHTRLASVLEALPLMVQTRLSCSLPPRI
ncbi:hypothetical protein BDR07DRAFT_1388687 [Suillus spraguei]|nr:hypothetical protein BDR07DRAFT_1388687 [Suillus spraguei]